MPRGRTVFPPDAERIVAEAASAGASSRDIAFALGVALRTLERRFGGALTKNRALRRIGIARKQTTLALKGAGNPTMLIWLGKQPVDKGGLGQTDRLELGPKPDFRNWSTEDLRLLVSGRMKLGPAKGDG